LSARGSHIDCYGRKWTPRGHSVMIAIQGHSSLARQDRRIAASFAGAVLALAVSFPSDGEAASCRGYPREVRAAIKKHVGALRALEQETADRVKGFDTRPFSYLLGRARATAAVVADKDALAAEETLSRCPQTIPPVRRVCAEAAQALIDLIEEQETGTASAQSKQLYAQAMPQCERWMDFAPLATVFRAVD
jgi:hypothetical protein